MEYNVQFSSQNDKVSTDVNVQGGKTFALHLFKTGKTLEATMQSNEQELDASFSSMQVVGGGGSDGFSPIVDVEPIEGGHRLTITDTQGTETADIMDGQDGISPVVSVEDIDGGHRVTITDKDGEKTFDVMDGKDGTGGSGGEAVQSDWAVNDENDPAFIKNRPFYSYTETAVSEAELASGTYTSEYAPDYGCFLAVISTDSSVIMSAPCYYNVTFDGKEYQRLESYSTEVGWFLGNGSILAPLFAAYGLEPPADTGEPFVLKVSPDESWAEVLMATDLTQSTTHEVTFLYCKETVSENITKLPSKYYDGVGARYGEPLIVGGEIFNNYGSTNPNTAGNYAHAEGFYTNADGIYSHAEGFATNATGAQSHAEGHNTYASGINSHAEGFATYAEGVRSHAEGCNTHARGENSHAEGDLSSANGSHSHAEGYNTAANGTAQHVEGQYNIPDYDTNNINSKGRYLHIAGNGPDSASRSNAHTLDWNGVPWYQGRPQFGGVEQDNGSQTVMANGDTEIILKSPNGSRWGITVSDDGTLTVTAK